MILSYKHLHVWQKSLAVYKETYKITSTFPKHELYSLTNQIRRSAVSIMSNIVKGHARTSSKEYMHFINIARGSVAELESQLWLSKELNYVSEHRITKILEELDQLGKMLRSLYNKIKEKVT